MKIRKLIYSISMLCLTTLLLITIMFAWYVSNTEATVSGIRASTHGYNCDIKLQRGTYDEANSKWVWKDNNNLLFSNIKPGNTFYFRILLDSKSAENKTVSVTFGDISSELITDKIILSDDEKKVLLKDGKYNVPLYTVDDKQVKVGNPSKVLYVINERKEIELKELKIEDVIYFYNIKVGSYDEPISKITSGNDYELLKNVTKCNFNVEGNKETWFYFALEFNENASLIEIDGTSCSNAYMYQKLGIGYISLNFN